MNNEQFKKNNEKMLIDFHPNYLKPLSPLSFYLFDDEYGLNENCNRIEIRSPTRSKSPHLKQLKLAIDELEDEFRKLDLEKDDQLLERADQIDRIQQECQQRRYQIKQKQTNRKKSSGTIVEPNIRKDDLFYRNLKQKKKWTKSIEKHPPFGIPLRPIRFSTSIDYLNDPLIEYKQTCEKRRNKLPDLLLDDLAYRSLRKDVFVGNRMSPATTFCHSSANINYEYKKMCQLLIRCLTKVSKEFHRNMNNQQLMISRHFIDYNNNQGYIV